MDITTLFKACIRTAKVTNKHLGLNMPKNNILHATNQDVHLSKAKEIIKHISSLHDFLLENKAAYLNVINYLSTNKTMSEIDKEKMDETAEDIVRTCKSLIDAYKREIKVLNKNRQIEEHYQCIIGSLETYLKNVSRIYTEAKAVRIKRVIDAHRLSKLETTPSIKENISKSILDDSLNLQVKNPKKVEILSTPLNYDEKLSTEDMQIFEQENAHLYNELNSISDEVKQMESKVVHIAELQEVFTEKVLQQEKDIERISNIVVGSTENVKDANEQIRQAIQRNAGLRLWVLFFLLVMSFSLLFLDWYND